MIDKTIATNYLTIKNILKLFSKLFIFLTLFTFILSGCSKSKTTLSLNSDNDPASTSTSNSTPFVYPSSGYNKVVLIEKVTATWCPPCATAATQYKTLLENYNHTQAMILRYGTSGDFYNDSLSSDAKSFISTRSSYYDTWGIPHSIVNGKPLSNWSALSTSTIDAELQTFSSYSISIEKSDKVTVTIEKHKDAGSDTNSYKLYTVLIEEEHTFDTAPGTNGQTHFEGTVLELLDSRTISFSDTDSKLTYTFNYSSSIPSISNRTPSKLAIVTFLQNDSNKQVLQTSYKKISD